MDVEFPGRGPLTVSRRTLLRTGVAASALVTATSWQPPAWGVDEYDTLRGRWAGLLTGSGFDPAASPYAGRLATLGGLAGDYQSSMAPATSSVWPDLPVGSVSANVTSSFRRLLTMALAYVQPSTGLTGNASLAAAIGTGLDWMVAHAYTASTTTYNNWWDWQIGAPQALEDTCVLMYGQLTPTQVASFCAAIDHFVPDSAVSSYTGTSTGANRVDLCRVLALRGVLAKSAAKLTTARNALSPVFPYVLTGDGLRADGSFVQHTYVPYAGTYGEVLVSGLSRLLVLLAGSTWAVTDPAQQNLYDAVLNAFAPFLFNGLVMDGVCGRGISRGLKAADPSQTQADDHTRGHSLIADVLRLAVSGAAPAAQAAEWKAMAKGWMRRDYYSPYLNDQTLEIPELVRAQSLLDDSAVTAAAEPSNQHRIFAMDRSVHRRAAWAATVSICSARTTFYETGNGENLRGWHTNSGMLQWWGSTYGNGQYSDAFWPTVNPYRLPGVTVSTKALADAAGGAWGASHPNAVWAGGATDGAYAAVGQDVRGLGSTLAGKKSWFFLDDSVVCLGAGISCSDGVAVETVVENRNLGTAGTSSLTVDGATQPATLGWSQQFAGARWMAIGGFGGYILPGGATVNALREARTGAWSDINTGGSTTALTRRYLTLWLNHGANPTSGSYSYIVMPGATAATTSARAASPTVTVLANTATAQAISDSASGVTAANFFAAGTAGPITVSGPASVLLRERNGTLTVAVSDPSRTSATVRVTIARSGYASATTGPGVSVLSTSGQLVLLAEVGGTQGASRTVTFSTSGTGVTAASALLAPTADAYVRDGSYGGTTYGTGTQLVVKNTNVANDGFNRRALLNFDVSGVTGTVRRAVLWTYGSVQDSGGSQTTLQAFALTSPAWSETVTWNTAPGLGTALGTGMVSTSADWVGLDVTSAVAAAVPSAGGSGTAALAIWEPLNASGLATVLNSRESSANRPVLEVITS